MRDKSPEINLMSRGVENMNIGHFVCSFARSLGFQRKYYHIVPNTSIVPKIKRV